MLPLGKLSPIQLNNPLARSCEGQLEVLTSYVHSQSLQGVSNLRPKVVDNLVQLPQREYL